jgi:hypothetical protein
MDFQTCLSPLGGIPLPHGPTALSSVTTHTTLDVHSDLKVTQLP